jgi:hypothetical protein
MERIRRFLLDETATAEATSTVVMIAAVGLVLAGGLFAYYTGLNGFFNSVGTGAAKAGSSFQWSGS